MRGDFVERVWYVLATDAAVAAAAASTSRWNNIILYVLYMYVQVEHEWCTMSMYAPRSNVHGESIRFCVSHTIYTSLYVCMGA